ncbi:MAG TPA: hypothetical protein VMH27_04880 [Puia sp.]|nr:hypothetical protein [Puia sp.]
MSTCNFTITFTGPASDVYTKIKTEIENAGGAINGDATAGSFSVPVLGSSIKGSYTLSGQDLVIQIDKKPALISCGQIEAYIKSHI